MLLRYEHGYFLCNRDGWRRLLPDTLYVDEDDAEHDTISQCWTYGFGRALAIFDVDGERALLVFNTGGSKVFTEEERLCMDRALSLEYGEDTPRAFQKPTTERVEGEHALIGPITDELACAMAVLAATGFWEECKAVTKNALHTKSEAMRGDSPARPQRPTEPYWR